MSADRAPLDHGQSESRIRQALELVRSAARSDYVGFPGSANRKMEEATTLLVATIRDLARPEALAAHDKRVDDALTAIEGELDRMGATDA